MNLAERKRQLIAEGALHRAQTVLARESLRASVQPVAMAKDAFQSLAAGGLAAYVGSGTGAGLVAKATLLLPLATRTWAFLSGRGAAIRLAAVGAAAGAAWVYLKRKRR